MEGQSLLKRVEELEERLGQPEHIIFTLNYMLRSLRAGESRQRYQTVEKIARALGLIPIAFYRKADGEVEDLGIEGFLYGEEVDNYIGMVFRKRRTLTGLSQKDLAEITGASQPMICGYEAGTRVPSIIRIETVSAHLGLVPAYLLPRLERGTATEGTKTLGQLIKLFEGHIRASGDLAMITRALSYLNTIVLERQR